MRIAVVGAGATGAFLGAKLAQAGEDVVLIARGAHLAAMHRDGVQVLSSNGDFTARPECTDDMAVVREADVAFLTLKAYSLPAIAPTVGGNLGPDTAVVTAQNGIPWWYFYETSGPLAGTRLESVDPGGTLSDSIPAERIVGCVVYPATRLVAPGVIEHVEGTRFSIGELDGRRSDRTIGISRALTGAGLKAPIRPKIRDEIWLKLLGNVAFNPLSALTRATLEDIARDPATRDVARAMMSEADRVARALGVELTISVEQRLAGAESVGAHKTSMLQDLESGRPLELDALSGAVIEIADLLDIPVPTLRCVHACACLLSRTVQAGTRA